MDSYYLTEECRDYLRRNKVQYITSTNRGHFATIVDKLDRKLDKSGTYVTVYNKRTKEVSTYC